ncbi:MAG: tryptophan 2,3-dioxygenase [Deltaproteobacteria bacterium]|nr:tryptophan 2,3-dioxygenase [Deltaproteobacteria bacterium]
MEKEKLTYASYLKVPELLTLQKPLSSPVAHDELLFIITHQAYELWFKQVIFELEAIIQFIDKDSWTDCFHLFNRVNHIFKVMILQIDVLETMTAEDFNHFRSKLNPASGFQSGQFREFELLVGVNPEQYAPFMKLDPEWKDRIQTRARLSTLRSAFVAALTRHNLTAKTDPDSVRDAVVEIYRNRSRGELRTLCENLIQIDEQTWLWRFRHLQMVERMIGMKPGTGGSLGAGYLETTLKKRLFPELWDARTYMGGVDRPEYGSLRNKALTGLPSAPVKRKGTAKRS